MLSAEDVGFKVFPSLVPPPPRGMSGNWYGITNSVLEILTAWEALNQRAPRYLLLRNDAASHNVPQLSSPLCVAHNG